MPEAIGVTYAAGVACDSSPEVEKVSVENEFTGNEPLWRDCNRGKSLENCRNCDVIFRQFFHIESVQSGIKSQTAEGERILAMHIGTLIEPEESPFARPD